MTNKRLREICIENNWFTCGTNGQYDKLFKANDESANEDDLSTMIWICSCDVSRIEIIDILKRENLPVLSILDIRECLINDDFSGVEIDCIIDCLTESERNGIKYRTI